jgi:hypothetical protein
VGSVTQYGTLLFPWFSVCWWRLHDDEIPVCGDRSLFCAASAEQFVLRDGL